MITINLDQAQLDEALAFINKQRASEKPPLPALTAEQWVELRFGRILENTLAEAAANEANAVVAAFTAATKEEQDQVKQALKLDASPVTPK